MPAPSGFDHASTTKSNSTRSIATHPCKKRKEGAPSVGMVHATIVKGGPPAELANYYLAHSARADMYRRLGRTAEARSSYEKALALTQQEPEAQFLQERIRQLK